MLVLPFITLLFIPRPLSSAVKSQTDLEFNIGNDDVNEMLLSPNGLILNTGFAYSVQKISENITLGIENLVLVDSTTGDIELTLPAVRTCKGRVYTIKKISAANSVTINAEGFEATIDGAHQYEMGAGDRSQMGLVSDGDEWFVTSKEGEDINGLTFTEVSSDRVITNADPNLIVDTSGGDVYLTLPYANSVDDGFSFQFIKSNNDHNVYIASSDYDDTIDSENSLSLNDKGSFRVTKQDDNSWTTPDDQQGTTAEDRPLKLKIEVSDDLTFTLPFNEDEAGLNVTIHWGADGDDDSENDTLVVDDNGDLLPSYSYSSPGIYTIEIHENQKGYFTGLQFSNHDDAASVIELTQWGTLQWKSLKEAFHGCSELEITAKDSFHARTGKVSNFVSAWEGCTSLTSFPFIHTDGASNMNKAWSQCTSMKGPFPLLNTSNVTSFWRTWQACSELGGTFPDMDYSLGQAFTQTWSGVTSATFSHVPNFAAFKRGVDMYEGVSLETSFWDDVLIQIADQETTPSEDDLNSIKGGKSWHSDSAAVLEAISTLEDNDWIIDDMGLEVNLTQDTIIDAADGITKIYADSSDGDLYLLFPDANESESITVVKSADQNSVLIASEDRDDRFNGEYRLIMSGIEGQEIIIDNNSIDAWTTSNGEDISAQSDAPFQIEVEIEPDLTFTLPLSSYGNPSYDINIDWGDDTNNNVTSVDDTNLTHTYSETKTYVISITENTPSSFGSLWFDNTGDDKDKVISIKNWGQVTPMNINGAFWGCTNMTLEAEDSLHARIQRATAFYRTFRGCTNLTGTFPNMNTGHMTSFNEAFSSSGLEAIGFTNLENLLKGLNAFPSTGMTEESWGNFLINLNDTNSQDSFSNGEGTLTGPGQGAPSAEEAIAAKAALVSDGWTIVD